MKGYNQMLELKNTKNLETIKTLDSDHIFARVVQMVSMDQLGCFSLFNYEFALVPTSLFQDARDAK